MESKEIKREVYNSNDKKLIDYVQSNFEKGSLSSYRYRKNIELLNELEQQTINVGLARMTSIKEENDLGGLTITNYQYGLIIAAFASYIITYVGMFWGEKVGLFISSVLTFALVGYIAINVSRQIRVSKEQIRISSSFYKLLSLIKEDQKSNVGNGSC